MEGLHLVKVSLLLLITSVSVTWGFSTSGVPCYLHPTGDGCHYKQKPDSPSCTSGKTRAQLESGVKQLNRSMYSLEQQLIELGVIPPDNACSELPAVDNGGVVYTDLNLAPGCTGKYICNEGYFLQSPQGQREFNCTEEGIWNGNVTKPPVQCILMVDRCAPPNEIANGNITFMDNDSENLLPGDMITYSCNDGFKMVGTESLFCLRTGNWSGEQPDCIRKKNGADSQAEIDKRGMIAGVSISSGLLGLAIAVIVIVVIVFVAIKWGRPAYRRRKESNVYSPSSSQHLIVSDEPAVSPTHPSHVSEYTVLAGSHTSGIAKAAADIVQKKKLSGEAGSSRKKSGKPPTKPKPKTSIKNDLEESMM